MINPSMSLAGIALSSALLLMPAGRMAQSQVKEARCLEYVRGLYDRLSAPPPAGKVYAISYSITVRSRHGGKLRTSSATTRMLMSHDRIHVRSDQMEIYQDGKETFTVIPGSKVIYAQDAEPGEGRKTRLKMFGALQDSLFAHCAVTKCLDVNGSDGREKRQVTLQMDETVRKLYKIASVSIVADKENETIEKIEFGFTAGGDLEWMQMVIDNADYNHTTDEFKRPLSSFFLNAAGTLDPQYRNYSIVDNRRGKRR